MKFSNHSFLTCFILLVISMLSFSSCKKKRDDPQPTPIIIKPKTTVPDYYFEGTFGDTKLSYKESVNNFYSGITSSSNGQYNNTTNTYDYHFSEGATWNKIVRKPGEIQPTYSNSLEILYNKFVPNVDPNKYPTQSDLEKMYPVGTSTLFSTTSTGFYENDGWRIEIRDDGGNFWDSYYATSDQSTSFVTIESRGNEVINNQNAFVIKGSFSCNVYDQNGISKKFSGKFYEIFSAYSY